MENQKVVVVRSISEIFSFLNEYDNDKPLRRILLTLKRQSKEGILIEITENYKNPEIELEMEELRYLEHIRATRLDFYYVSQIHNGNAIKGSYQGYVILRPRYPDYDNDTKLAQRVGDTVIAFPEDKGKLQYFITCKTKIPTDNSEESLDTYPFLQQHWSKRWQCGFAALRMFSKWLKYKTNCVVTVEEKYKNLTLPQIDELLDRNKYSDFEVDDFKRILTRMGFTPVVYEYNNPNKIPALPPEQIVYSYIESGMPVFVIFGTESDESGKRGDGHVVSVIGHTFNPDAWWPEAVKEYSEKTYYSDKAYYSKIFEGKPRYLRSIAWVDFIIHDDNYGPFLIMPKDFLEIDEDIYRLPKYPNQLPTEIETKLREERNAKIANSRIWEVIVPFRKDILILAEDAEAIAFKTIIHKALWKFQEDYLRKYDNLTKDWRAVFNRHLESGNIVLRTFLINFSELLKMFPKDKEIFQYIEQSLKKQDKIGNYPELMWFVEISIPELFAHERYRMGEIIVDATYRISDIKKGFLKAVKYAHLPGVLLWLNNGEQVDGFWINEEPYHHLIR